ncbi:Uncharacterized protein APZ42_024758 [Daphnia magna]|uniref:Uncharacterized protein n=1 Tax=Daphnia magna TaxID=35525 RepID=A0A164TTD8_9CRUS|nr:Uncharacterized protein APZ42_024758 [Daphnia magna]
MLHLSIQSYLNSCTIDLFLKNNNPSIISIWRKRAGLSRGCSCSSSMSWQFLIFITDGTFKAVWLTGAGSFRVALHCTGETLKTVRLVGAGSFSVEVAGGAGEIVEALRLE